jgi:hypothetical protein
MEACQVARPRLGPPDHGVARESISSAAAHRRAVMIQVHGKALTENNDAAAARTRSDGSRSQFIYKVTGTRRSESGAAEPHVALTRKSESGPVISSFPSNLLDGRFHVVYYHREDV